MFLFDANCHVGPWPQHPYQPRTVPELLEEMQRLGIAKALVRHTWGWWYDPRAGNTALEEELRGRPQLLPCLAVSPLLAHEMGGEDSFLEAMRRSGARAVCLYPGAQHFVLARWCAGRLLDLLQERRIPVLLEKEEVSWAELYALASDWPLLRIVVLRTGYRILRQCLPLLQSTEHVYLDISYLADNEALEVICAAVGSGRLVFGTGTPRVDGAGAVARLAYAGLGEREKELIAAGNLEALLAGAMLD
jgi:hypothetical protein